jgi:single-strand DNA-binding protein
MALSSAEIRLKGFVGGEPELRYTPNGHAVASFRMATSRNWKQGEEWKSETTWWRVTAWNDLAERIVAPLIHKGSLVQCFCRPAPDANGNPPTFTRRDGTTGSTWEMVASEIDILQKPPKSGGDNGVPMPPDDSSTSTGAEQGGSYETEDIPF